jgi:hypothetical protein
MSGSSWSNNAVTSLTLPTGAQDPTPRIVEDGITDTILIYGPGGILIASIAATAGTDALGNHYPAGISASGGFVSLSTVLMYSGTPATGTLTTSMASVAGTDSFGNQYPPGVTTYDRGNNVFANMQGGLNYWGALVAGQPDTNNAGMIESTSIQLIMQSPITSVGSFQDSLELNVLTGQPSQVTGASNTPQLALADAVNSSDADLRLSGSVIKTNLNRVPYTWQTPSLVAGWTAAGFAGDQGFQVRLDGMNNVVLDGELTTPAVIAGTTTSLLSTPLPAAYRPTKGRRFPIYQSTGTAGTYATGILHSDGNVFVQNPTALAAGAIVGFEVSIPLGIIP